MLRDGVRWRHVFSEETGKGLHQRPCVVGLRDEVQELRSRLPHEAHALRQPRPAIGPPPSRLPKVRKVCPRLPAENNDDKARTRALRLAASELIKKGGIRWGCRLSQ